MGTIVIIVIATGIGIFNDVYKKTEYELKMEDGTTERVMLQTKSSYACPLYCKTDHVHQAVMVPNGSKLADNSSLYHIYEGRENVLAMYCSNRNILSMNKLKDKKTKEMPDIVNASQSKDD